MHVSNSLFEITYPINIFGSLLDASNTEWSWRGSQPGWGDRQANRSLQPNVITASIEGNCRAGIRTAFGDHPGAV